VNPETVVLCAGSDPADTDTLRSAGLKVVKLPMPRPLWFDGRQLPASYANFYIANGLVPAPAFNHPNDRAALTILAKQFPGREVVPQPRGIVLLRQAIAP
jgi:agmatine/peptidylarginine deiminase